MNYIDAHEPVIGQPATNSGPVAAGKCLSCGEAMYLGIVHSCSVTNISSVIGSDPRIYGLQATHTHTPGPAWGNR